MIRTILTCLTLAVLAAPATATVLLREDAHVTQSLVAAQVGDTIRKTCPTMSARMVVAIFKAQELERYALDKGYPAADIKAFLKDKTEKARIKALAADYIAKNGGKAGDAASFCALGQSEIAKGSLIGSLLRDEG